MTTSTDPSRHTNRLIHETSPYLLQHAHNPVDWYPWGEEALARAQAENKPILLSIGYSACHWCHVMERESFENEAIAALMNRPLREHQGGPRRAARPGRHLHGGHAGPEPRPGRLADDGVPDAGPAAVLRGDLLPPAGPLRAPRLLAPSSPRSRSCGDGAGADLVQQAADARPRTSASGPGPSRAATSARRRSRAAVRATGRRRSTRPTAASAPRPSSRRPRTLSLLLRIHRRTGDAARPGHGHQDPGRHGPGRDVRPDRRRLRPLLHGRALAGPPLREDAVRQRPAREGLPGGLPGHGGRRSTPGSPARSSTTSCAR